jgi:hypothetical protein
MEALPYGQGGHSVKQARATGVVCRNAVGSWGSRQREAGTRRRRYAEIGIIEFDLAKDAANIAKHRISLVKRAGCLPEKT